MTLRPIRVLVMLAVLSLLTSAGATDLADAWKAAQTHHPEFLAADAAHAAGSTHRAQQTALWLPSVTATASLGKADARTATSGAQFSAPGFGQSSGVSFDTSIRSGTANSWLVTARQPLLSGERSAQAAALGLSADVADARWVGDRERIMMEVARTYLAAVLADETLRVLQQEHTAVETALADVQERFRQGDVPATDTHEAAAREKSLQAQILAARTDDDVRHQALADMIGIEPAAQVLFAPSSKTEQLIQPGVDSLTQVLAQATEGNPELKARHGAVELAREQVRRYRATADTSVDLVARVGRDAISGSGDFGGAANSASSALIGVQVSIPVFTGGYHSAQHDEARHLLDQAVAEETRARQQVALQTRSAWMTIRVGRERIEALVQALKANQDRYDTTRLGHDVGDRSTLDLLNARSDAARAELDLLQARADLIVQRLQLLALTGHLDDTQLHDVSGVLTQSLTPSADPGMPVAMTSR